MQHLKISKSLLTGFFPLLRQDRIAQPADITHGQTYIVDSKRNSCMEFMVLHTRKKDREKNSITGVSLEKTFGRTKHFSLPNRGSDC